MSNLATQGRQEVDFFKTQRPDAAFQSLDPNAESLADGIGSSYGVIHYRGKTWSLRYKGETHIFTRQDDGTPANYIDVIILRSPAVKSRSYYESWEDEASLGKRPICASLGGIKPDNDVQEKQADVCGLCPRNEWKTDAKGKKTRDCSEYKRLAVLLLPSDTQRLLGAPLMEPVFLRVPPASLTDLANFGEQKAREQWHYSSFVTRISFDVTKAHPQFIFKGVMPLGSEEAKIVMELREDMQAKRITGENEVPLVTRVDPSPPASLGLAVALGGQPVASGFGERVIPGQLTQDTRQEAPLKIERMYEKGSVVDLTPQPGGAFGITLPPDEPSTNPGASGLTAADTGDVVEDTAMDARIAQLMKV